MTIRDELVEILTSEFPTQEAFDWAASALIRDHGAALVEALDAKRAIEEQAAVTECVSVTGRDPSDVIRDVIGWHIHVCVRAKGGES